MSEWIEVNGAKIEKTFFNENVEEARSYEWTVSDLPSSGHTHCMVCGLAMPTSGGLQQTAYRSLGGWVDGYCYEHFVCSK